MAGDSTLRDAHLVLKAFAASDWGEVDVATGGMRLRVSRRPLGMEPASSPGASPGYEAVDGSEREEIILTAPHLADLRETAAAGARIERGEVYTTLDLLGTAVPLRAPSALRIVAALSRPGELLEYGSAILRATKLD